MKRLLLIILIICVIFVMTDTIAKKELDAKDCKCCIMVECYYPGYKPGIDVPFARKIVYSCEEAEEYMQHISQPAFFFLYPAKP